MTNSFSIKRLWAFSCAEIGAQRRALTINLLVFIGAAILIYLVTILFYGFGSVSPTRFIVSHNIITLMITIYMIVYIASIFVKYHRGREASAAMLLPVSKGEKFTYAMLVSLVAMPLALSVLDFAIFHLMSFVLGLGSQVSYWSGFSAIENMTVVNYIAELAYLSTFFLGAAIFRRRQLLYTLLSQIVVFMIVAISFVAYVKVTHTTQDPWFMNNPDAWWFHFLVGTLFLISMITLAWWRFKKLQIK